MKRIYILIMALMVIAMALPSVAGEKPKGQKMSSSSKCLYTISALATKRDTTTLWTMRGVENYSNLIGRVRAGYYTSTLAALTGCDTTKDTIYISILTGSSNTAFNDTTIWTDTIVPVDSDYQIVEFDISDSLYYEYVYFYIITNVNDAAPVGTTLTYEVTAELYAR